MRTHTRLRLSQEEIDILIFVLEAQVVFGEFCEDCTPRIVKLGKRMTKAQSRLEERIHEHIRIYGEE